MIPDMYTEINEADAKKFQKMLDLLDDDDDVKKFIIMLNSLMDGMNRAFESY